MILNLSKIMFMLTLMLSTFMVISSQNWLGIWMGLEINLISFVPLMFKAKSPKSSEAMMMYFLTQAMGSAILLMAVLMSSWSAISINSMNELAATTIILSLALKMGAAPFHFWLPEVMNKMEWTPCLILTTWQKIAPMTVMSYMANNSSTLLIIAASSTLIGAIGGLNQVSLRKIMAYSSISHLGWMIACMSAENFLWIIYLMIYFILVTLSISIFKSTSTYYMNQYTMNKTVTEKFAFTFTFMSMGGLPPFLGFIPKWMVIQTLAMNNNFFILTFMVLMSLITLFYYLRLNSALMMITSINNKWMTSSPKTNMVLLATLFINLMTPLMALINFM